MSRFTESALAPARAVADRGASHATVSFPRPAEHATSVRHGRWAPRPVKHCPMHRPRVPGDVGSAAQTPPPAASISESVTFAGPAATGKRVGGRYSLIEGIGRGGMGEVWKTRDDQVGRLVALKRPRGAKMASPAARGRFVREARAMARLAHPNIVTVYDADEDADGPFIVMEYVTGPSLRDEVRRARHGLDERRVSEVAVQLCDALAMVHAQGIIHRDIKPANVLLTEQGTPKLGDFGLVALRQRDSPDPSMTLTGAILVRSSTPRLNNCATPSAPTPAAISTR